jgi:sensor domain CHASE-containing protein
MSLRSRVLVIVLGIVLTLVTLDYVIQSRLVEPKFAELERQSALDDVDRVIQAVRREIQSVGDYCLDYSGYDRTWVFASQGDDTYIKEELGVGYFKRSDLQAIYFLDTAGKVLWGQSVAVGTDEAVAIPELPTDQFPADHPLLQYDRSKVNSAECSVQGVLSTSRGAMLVAARPIVKSDLSGDAAGTLIMGRLLDSSRAKVIAQQTRTDLTLWSEPDEIPKADREIFRSLKDEKGRAVHEESQETLAGHAVLAGLNGKPAAMLRVDIPREITAKGREATEASAWLTIAEGVAVLVALWLLLDGFVVRPLRELTRLSRQIGRDDDMNRRVKLDRKDEIGQLGAQFDRMLDQLQAARDRMTNESYYDGMAALTQGALLDIQRGLEPLQRAMAEMREDLDALPLAELRSACQALATPAGDDADPRQAAEALAAALPAVEAFAQAARDRMDLAVEQVAELEHKLGDPRYFQRRPSPVGAGR